jgi:hypothetical protein
MNGLILPGSGHLYIKRYKSGIFILLIFLVASVMAIYRLVTGALLFFDSAEDFRYAGEFFSMLIGDLVFLPPFAVSLLLWLTSIIDGWRITRGGD